MERPKTSVCTWFFRRYAETSGPGVAPFFVVPTLFRSVSASTRFSVTVSSESPRTRTPRAADPTASTCAATGVCTTSVATGATTDPGRVGGPSTPASEATDCRPRVHASSGPGTRTPTCGRVRSTLATGATRVATGTTTTRGRENCTTGATGGTLPAATTCEGLCTSGTGVSCGDGHGGTVGRCPAARGCARRRGGRPSPSWGPSGDTTTATVTGPLRRPSPNPTDGASYPLGGPPHTGGGSGPLGTPHHPRIPPPPPPDPLPSFGERQYVSSFE